MAENAELQDRMLKIQKLIDKVEEYSKTQDLAVLYDLFLDYSHLTSDIAAWGVCQGSSSDIEHEGFMKTWNAQIGATCGDLNSVLKTMETAFQQMTDYTTSRHRLHEQESPFLQDFINQIDAQLTLNGKIISHNRDKFLFIMTNALHNHERCLKAFGEYLGKDSRHAHMF